MDSIGNRDRKPGHRIKDVAYAAGEPLHAKPADHGVVAPQKRNIGHLGGKCLLKLPGGAFVCLKSAVGRGKLFALGKARAECAACPERPKIYIIIQLYFANVQFKITALHGLLILLKTVGLHHIQRDALCQQLLGIKRSGIRAVAAAVDVLTGKACAEGKLPVALSE